MSRRGVSFVVHDLSSEDKMVTIAVAGISGVIDERSQDWEAEPADRPICRVLIEIGQGAQQRVEWPAVIAERDLQPICIEGKGNSDPAEPRGLTVIAVVDGIGEQLLEDDQEPSPLSGGQSVAAGEPLGKAGQSAKLGRIAAQAE
jgi:hypothetical protein